MSDQPHASIAEHDGVITVTMDRDAKLNAISRQVTACLWEAHGRLFERNDLRCMVITAKGRYFSAGIDLSESSGAQGSGPSSGPHGGWHYRRRYAEHHRLYDAFEATEKPIILAAQGPCLGAGFEMAMSCDFRFCTPQADWCLPEINIGVIAGSGGSSRLTRLVGPAWAKYIAMAGVRITAERAQAMGIVHDIFPPEDLMTQVYAFCDRLKKLPAEALGLAKIAIDLAADTNDRNVQRTIDRLVNTTLVESPEHRERIARFVRK